MCYAHVIRRIWRLRIAHRIHAHLMKSIIFVCHGNICRSPAAEWIMKHLLQRFNLEEDFFVVSRATSLEEIGNDIYPPMKRALYNREIPFFEHHAKRIDQEEFDKADFIFYMDNLNKRYLERLFGELPNKCQIITKYTENLEYIDDPWYTGQFDNVVNQLEECCESIITKLLLKIK